jgi:hypothetical protein
LGQAAERAPHLRRRSVEENKAFAAAQRAPFPLLSDSNNIMRKVRAPPALPACPPACLPACCVDCTPGAGPNSPPSGPPCPALPRPPPQAFGIKGDFLGLLPGRQTFVISKDGICILRWAGVLTADRRAWLPARECAAAWLPHRRLEPPLPLLPPALSL